MSLHQTKPSKGFSLIELLVVVAIIGVLASVGFVGYQAYIDSSRDGVARANTENVGRVLQTDDVALKNDLSAKSSFATTHTSQTLCRDRADELVHQLNAVQKKKNPHNASCPFAFNGNRAWHAATHLDTATSKNYFAAPDGCPVTKTTGVISVPRGQMMAACVVSNAKVNDADFRLYVCACEGDAACDTTDVFAICNAPGNGGYASASDCLSKWIDDNQDKCASPGFY